MINPDWKTEVPEDFSDASRVWVYQSSRPFTAGEHESILQQLTDYTGNWISHNRPVKGWGTVFFNRFIVLMADDTMDRLCGSAVDSSLRFIKELETQYDLELLNRMNMGFVKEDVLLIVPFHEVEDRVSKEVISAETPFFNNAVTTKGQFLAEWIQPFEESFLGKKTISKAVL